MSNEYVTGSGEPVKEKHGWKESLAAVPKYFDEKLPSMDKNLDTYFDQNMPAIIEEWGLVTAVHLDNFERRLARVTTQIDNLEKDRPLIEKRADALDKELKKLEGS
jgi:U3 small nucleolar ribonucleoprotein component